MFHQLPFPSGRMLKKSFVFAQTGLGAFFLNLQFNRTELMDSLSLQVATWLLFIGQDHLKSVFVRCN